MQRDKLSPLRLATILPVLPRHLQRNFNGRRSVVRVEDAGQSRRQYRYQLLCKLDRRFVSRSREENVFELCSLGRERSVQRRMRMPVDIDPPR